MIWGNFKFSIFNLGSLLNCSVETPKYHVFNLPHLMQTRVAYLLAKTLC